MRTKTGLVALIPLIVLLVALTLFAATTILGRRDLRFDSFDHYASTFHDPAGFSRIVLARELRRLRISESRLPSGGSGQFQQPTFWWHYRWLIILVLAVCLFEAVLIDVLLRERRRRRLAQERLEERLRFEKLVSDLSSTFINLAPEKVESRIVDALGQVASLLRFDVAALSVFTGRGTEGRVAYLWWTPGVPEIPPNLTDEDFPWSAQELFAGRDVCLRSMEMLPQAARIDRATYEKYHVRSSYSVPLMAGGKAIGVLGLNTVWEEREMIPELLQGQRLLGEIFANALARRATEQSLRESERNFRSLAETTAAVPWEAVETWTFVYVGPQAVSLLGYSIDQWYEKDFWVSHLHPADREFAVNTCTALSKSTEEFEFEYRMIDATGATVWVHDIVKCEHRNAQPVRIRGFLLNVTARKQAEEALRETEQRVSLAANTAGLGLWVWDAVSDDTWITPEGRRLFGWAEFEPVNLERFIRTLHADDREPTRQALLQALQSGRDYFAEYRVVGRDGSARWVSTHGRVDLDVNGTPLRIRGVSIDITERKRVEEALEKERRFLRQVIDIDPNFIFAKDRDGRFTLVNHAVAHAYGTTVENLIGKTDADFNPNREEVEFFHRMDLEVLDTLKERFIPEERLTDARGRVRWLQTVKRPIINDDDGCANQILGASTDITQRKNAEAELERNRQELAHVTRISTMGELAASLAHELNQPLTAILSNAQAAQRFLAANPGDVEEVREILTDIIEDNRRASEVIQRMRALVKKEELAFAPVDVADVVRDVIGLVHSDAILHGVRILLELNPGLPSVRGDKVQLQQVVLNLLLNAFDSMKDCAEAERHAVVRAEPGGDGMVKIAVGDHGTGLQGDLDKIFEPFYTTKRDGLGMGLSISRSIIDAHGGRLWAENNQNCGATFYFTVPVPVGDSLRTARIPKI